MTQTKINGTSMQRKNTAKVEGIYSPENEFMWYVTKTLMIRVNANATKQHYN
jgi:hypothetical protein